MDSTRMQDTLQGALEGTVAAASTWGLQVIGAIVVLIVGRWIAGMARKAVRRSLERSKVDATLVPFLSGGVYYLLLGVVIIAVLSLFGIETTSLVAVLGAAGLAVGLALQGSLSNFAAGVMLLLFRPIRDGDFVEVAGTSGSVREIGIFTTNLDTPDNVRIIVPNSSIFGSIIKNYNANDTRRLDLTIGISYDDDIAEAVKIVDRVVKADARTLDDPAPTIAVGGLGDSSVDLVVRPWCNRTDYWPLRFDLLRALKEELEAGGCTIPYPQRDVHLAPPPTP